MQLYRLSVNHREQPLGVDPTVRPYFGWKMHSRKQDTRQTAYRITLTEEGKLLWDSGRLEQENSSFVVCGCDLQPCTLYEWTVTVWDNHGEEASARSRFETALAPDGWKAKWMRTPRPYVQRQKGFGTQPPATLFRRAFTLPAPARRARLYATCLGIYRLTVNGQRPDKRELAPEHTSYRKLLCYQTYDLTEFLQEGENVLGMEVGDGWFCCPQTMPPIDGLQPDHTVLFQLEVDCADGSRVQVCSDAQVLTRESPVRASDLFDGELYDARTACPGWDIPGFVPQGWAPALPTEGIGAKLIPQLDEPVLPVRELPAKQIYTSPKGETIVDFGQVVAGRTRFHGAPEPGVSVTLEHFEAVDAQGCYFNNVESAMGLTEQKDVFIGDGCERDYEARFTYHGFRYLRLTGVENPRPEQFTAVVLSTGSRDTGSFACSDPELNRLYENTRWSQRANMISIPTDCPQREKAGWTGDISLYAETALLNEDVTPLLTQWLRSLAADQRENGSVPFTVPDVSIYHYSGITMGEQTGCGGPVCSAGWGDAAVTVPMAMFRVTGNTEILRSQYPSMKGWVDYVIARARVHAPGSTLPDEVEEHLWNTGFQFGEWLVPSQSREPQEQIFSTMAATASYTAPIFGWLAVQELARAAGVLGCREDKAHYQREADAMKTAIRTALITPEGRMRVERQGAYVLMIAFDLVPDTLRDTFGDRLEALIHENGDRLDTGFLPTPYLLDALCRCGREELAYTLLFQKQAPSWLAQVEAGATTIWESWEMYFPDGTPKKESFNHYTYGTVDSWLFRHVAGLDQKGVGFRHLVIEPRPAPRLQWACRRFETEQGCASVHWKRKDGLITLTAVIPCNTDAEIRLPDGSCRRVGSGEYTFTCTETIKN